MAKNYLNKFRITLLVCFVFFCANIIAKESYSEIYVKITDATTALRNNDKKEAEKIVNEIKEKFRTLKNANSPQGSKVQELLNKGDVTEDNLKEITKALLAFEKEQNPVDETQVKKDFKAKVFPALDTLEKVIRSKDVEAMKKEYLKYNGVWTRNEAVIRDRDTVYYGKVETAMAFLRSSMEMEPFNYDNVISSFNDLKTVIQEFLDGKKVENTSSENITLKQAVDLLKEGLDAFKSGDNGTGQSKVKKFIQVWPTVEGDVSTRNGALYTKVETQTPVIMVKGGEKQYQEQLQGLIDELSQIDTKAEYTFLDAMFILLREGVEALLIVLALVSGLKAANQKRGLKWVYAGALAGILASVVIAVILQKVFPTVSSGTNREILEGFVGIFAVAMMIGIGVWLHSKSSLEAWKDYMERKMNIVVSTGSFISMFVLSFLAVFREGAETILFYVGILPLISVQNLIIGILSAIVILIIIALVLIYASSKIKVHRVFFILTWTIYFLAFKMLGTSIHMLQVVGVVPLHLIRFIPTVEILGIYANWEVFISQVIFIILIVLITLKRKK